MIINAISVSQLNRQIRNILEQDIGQVCVEGEISNLSKPSSGHLYFTMKDASAQVRCVFFRNRHTLEHKNLSSGQQVLARGTLSLYEARGDYQLIIDELSESGLGNLYRSFQLLKDKLSALGLFDANRKKNIPKFPQCIGVITSPSGAALRDILTTLKRRFPQALIKIYPSDVQGALAATQLISAIQRANKDSSCDVLILARGGGSIEDLWSFNDEKLAYIISDSIIPIVSGVGHETDITIADFVADVRAATPTAAAETVTPDKLELIAYFQMIYERILIAIKRYTQHKSLILHHEMQKITSPGQLVEKYWQALDYSDRRLSRAIQQSLTDKQHLLQLLTTRLYSQNPRLLFTKAKTQLYQLERQLFLAIDGYVSQLKLRLHAHFVTLHAVSPLATLDRGYAIATSKGQLLYESKGVQAGDIINIRLARGSLICEVLEYV